jgi:hypothetical protein
MLYKYYVDVSYKHVITSFVLCFSIYLSNTLICFYHFQNQPSMELLIAFDNFIENLLLDCDTEINVLILKNFSS